MSKTIKSSGGIATRLIETINGFKTKYGYWPDTILADSSTISVLATQCLSHSSEVSYVPYSDE